VAELNIGWGIIGCGNIARHAIAPAVSASKNGRLVAIASRTSERAERLARELGATRAYAGYEDLLEDVDVTAVYIGLPNGLHARWARAAAEAGKHVLCDKSLTLDVESALGLREAFHSRGLRLAEGYMYRHHPQWEIVKCSLPAIGEIRILRAALCGKLAEQDHRWSAELGGGALFDVTCYAVNVARWLLAAEPCRVTAVARLRAPGVDESTHALLEFEGGAVALVAGSLVSAADQGVTIVGTEGKLEIPRPFVPHFDPTEIRLEKGGAVDVARVGGANHFLHQIEHFASLLIDPGRPNAPAEDGVENITACCAIRESYERGGAVELPAPMPFDLWLRGR